MHTVHRTDSVGKEIVAEIKSGGYDLVVLGSRDHGRISSEILGSVNAHVHLHSKVPLLSIPPARVRIRKGEGVGFASSDTCSDSPNLQRDRLGEAYAIGRADFLHPGLDGSLQGHEQDGNRSAPKRLAHDACAAGRQFLRPRERDEVAIRLARNGEDVVVGPANAGL